MEKYLQILKTLNGQQKNEFLEKALKSSIELQSQLIAYFTRDMKDATMITVDFNKTINSALKKYKKELEGIDLEDVDWEKWQDPGDRYYEEWEVAAELSEQEIRDTFNQFKNSLLSRISTGDIAFFLAEFTALLIACHEADIEDPYDNLGDPQEFLIQCFEELTPQIMEAVSRTIFSPQSLSKTVVNVVEFWLKYLTIDVEAQPVDNLMKEMLKESAVACQTVYEYFFNVPEAKKIFPASYLGSLQIVEPENWAKEAEAYSGFNSGLAAELLDYQAKTDENSFYRIAKILFPIFTSRIVDHITPYLDLSVEKDFAKEVLEFKVLEYRCLDDYMLLSGLFNSEAEKKSFISKLREDWDNRFYIKVLEWEGMLMQIIEFARKSNPGLHQLQYILPPVINEFPQESFGIARKRIEADMAKIKGRDVYENVASLLKLVETGKETRNDVRAFVKELVTLYSRRPALKDELRKAGLF